MRYHNGDVFRMEDSRALLDRAIRHGKPLVLTHVLRPGLGDEYFQMPRWIGAITKEMPVNGTVASAYKAESLHSLGKRPRILGLYAILNRNEYGTIIRPWHVGELRFGPVPRGRHIERLATERKDHSGR